MSDVESSRLTGPLSRFARRRSTKARKLKGIGEKVDLRAYDVYVMVFHNRQGSYYCLTTSYFEPRAFTAEQITTSLQQYYAMLVRKGQRQRAFERDMSALGQGRGGHSWRWRFASVAP